MIDLPARTTRLGHLQDDAANPVHIAYIHVPLGHVMSRNILTKAAGHQRLHTLLKRLAQQEVVFSRVVMHGLFRSTMHSGVAMLVAHDTQRFDPRCSAHATFVDTGALTFRFQAFETACEEMFDV